MKTILLDVGGTFIKCSDGRTVAVNSDGGREEIVRALRSAVSGGAEDCVRVAVPGPFDYASGTFLMRHKFAAVYGENFADLAGLPRECFRYVHDVVAMLLGNVAPGSPNTALLTLGTGLGVGIVLDGQILEGCHGAAGETAGEICRTLGYPDGQAEAVDTYCRKMLSELAIQDPDAFAAVVDQAKKALEA